MKRLINKSDLKYSQVIEYTSLVKEGQEDIDLDFLLTRMLKIFYNINPKELRDYKQTELNQMVDDINTILQQPISEFMNVIEMDGIKYGFIPNFSEITAGELIDIESLHKDNKLEELTSILYRPIIGKINKLGQYKIEDYKGYDSKFKDVSYDIVEGYMSFFVTSYLLLSRLMNTSTPQIED